MARMRKLLCAVLCVALVLCTLCVPVFADEFFGSYYRMSGTAYFELYDELGNKTGTQQVTLGPVLFGCYDFIENMTAVPEFYDAINKKTMELEAAGYTVDYVSTQDKRTDGGNGGGSYGQPYEYERTVYYTATKSNGGNTPPIVEDYYELSATAAFELYDNGQLVGTAVVNHEAAGKPETEHKKDHDAFEAKVAAKKAELEGRAIR